MIDFLEFNDEISDEMLAAYIDGNSTKKESLLIESSLINDTTLAEAIEIAEDSKNLWELLGSDDGFEQYNNDNSFEDSTCQNDNDESEGIDIDFDLSNTNNNFQDLDLMDKKEAASMTIPPAAGAAAYKLWNAYNNGSLDFKETGADSDYTESVKGNRQDTYVGARPAETLHGQEELDIAFDPKVYQYYPDTCAIQSQHLILEQFGINVSQEEMIEVAKLNGWYAEGYGTPLDCVGKLLEHYGVRVEATEGNNIFNLASELSKGHQIIVSVDSGELVNPDSEINEDLLSGESADHSLTVVGLDTTNPDDVKVIVTDPGTGNKQWAYSEKQFLEAWKDSNCYMVSTEQSPQEYSGGEAPSMPDFAGIPTDIIDKMADVDLTPSYDHLDAIIHSLMNNPDGWSNVISDYPNIFNYDVDGTFHIYDPTSGQDLTLLNDDFLTI